MIRTILLASAALLSAHGAALAGAIERTAQSVAPLFEPGTYLSFSFTSVRPEVTGRATAATPTPGASSGDMAPSFAAYGVAFKTPSTDRIDAALIFDQPFGADTSYPVTTGYFARGSTATLNTSAFTGLLRYKFSEQISAFAGGRVQVLDARAVVPFVANYTGNAARSTGYGAVVGAAYERPEIGLRVALTYNSRIQHDAETTETAAVLAGPATSTTRITTPQSVNLEFQTGLNPKTLLFGSVRWVEWSKFDITPSVYQRVTGGEALVSYDEDIITYNIGIGRRLTDRLAIAGTFGYEAQTGGFASNLSPTDGRTSVGLAATYTQGQMEITTGVNYTWIGDAQSTLNNVNAASDFNDNTAIGFGLRVAFKF